MNNHIVQIIYGTPHILKLIEDRFVGIQNFNEEIIQGINILNYMGNPVTEDVLECYNSLATPETEAITGKWIPHSGWQLCLPLRVLYLDKSLN